MSTGIEMIVVSEGYTSSKFSACSGFRLAPAGPNDMIAELNVIELRALKEESVWKFVRKDYLWVILNMIKPRISKNLDASSAKISKR